jgi:hypothetical protein
MKPSSAIATLAQSFQASIPGLLPNNCDYATFHDALHLVLGYAVSYEDESRVLMVECLLGGRDIPESAIESASIDLLKISTDLLIEFSNFYSEYFAS